MTRTHLRAVLLGVVLMAGLGTWTNNTMTSVIPLSVMEEMESGMPGSTLRVLSMSAVFLAHIGFGVIGLVGMFLLWSPSRHVYMLSAVSRAVLPAFFAWMPHSGIDLTVRACWLLLDGLVLGLVFWGPAAPLFNRCNRKGIEHPSGR